MFNSHFALCTAINYDFDIVLVVVEQEWGEGGRGGGELE